MWSTLRMVLESLIIALKALLSTLPDRRTGDNGSYSMTDIGMSAFSVFFLQSPSFLSHQTALERGRGTSNCQTLFGMIKIPTDNHVRSMLDPVPPTALFPMFPQALGALEAGGGLAPFKRLGDRVSIGHSLANVLRKLLPAQVGNADLTRLACPQHSMRNWD